MRSTTGGVHGRELRARGDERGPRRRWGVAAAVAAAAATTMTVLPVPAIVGVASAAATRTVALYQMDENAGSTVLVDSSGNGVNGTIGAEVVTGMTENGVRFHRFPNLAPGAPPPTHPEHLDRVPENDLLDPGTGDFSVTFRFRTTKSYGNIIQKGQNATKGGYFKFEAPNGIVTCLFKGGDGSQRAVNSVRSLSDGQWHIVKCERTATGVTMLVDGVVSKRLNGPTGNIDNDRELTIGGKGVCDQIKITCDYFPGDIDYVRIEKGAGGTTNQKPTASFTSSCDQLACTFNGSASSDPDGHLDAYSWDFGDGGRATGPTASHAFVSGGTYTVKLTVVDDAGGTASTTRSVTVNGTTQTGISFVSRVITTGNKVSYSVQIPAGVRAGDGLLLLFSQNNSATRTIAGSSTGWVSVGSNAGGFAQTQVWRKVATAADAGATVRIDLSKQAKGSLTLLAYRGTNGTNPVAAVAETTPTGSSAARTTPTVNVANARSWVVSFWMHGDGATTALSVPGAVTSRAAGSESGGGRVTTLAADSGGPAGTGSYGGLTANAAAASTTASVWTIVLAPA